MDMGTRAASYPNAVLSPSNNPLDSTGNGARRLLPSSELPGPPYPQHYRLCRSWSRGAARPNRRRWAVAGSGGKDILRLYTTKEHDRPQGESIAFFSKRTFKQWTR